MDIWEAIKGRRSIRKFDEKREISLDILKELVGAGRLAPSAANLQPWEFITVNDKKRCEEIFPYLKWAGYIAPEGNPQEGEHPAAYIILVANPRINRNFQHDFGAAAENMMLLAYSMGIGTCWIGSINRERIRQVLDIPDDYEIDTIIALGYPKEKSVTEKEKGSIKYYKDREGTLHVPKKALEKIIHVNEW